MLWHGGACTMVAYQCGNMGVNYCSIWNDMSTNTSGKWVCLLVRYYLDLSEYDACNTGFGAGPPVLEKPFAIPFWLVDRCFQNGFEIIAKDTNDFNLSKNRSQQNPVLSNHQPHTNYIVKSFSTFLRHVESWSQLDDGTAWLIGIPSAWLVIIPNVCQRKGSR